MTDRTKLEIDLAATSEAIPDVKPGALPIPDTPPHVLSEPVPAASGRFGKVVDRVGVFFAVCFLVSTGIILFEIVMRYVFLSPTIWVHETTTFLCGISFAYGGLYALSRDRHIRVVLIYDAVPPRARRVLDIVLSIIGLVTMLFFAFAAWSNASRSIFTPQGVFRLETTGSAWNPPYPGLVKLFLFGVIVAMAIQFVILIINYARGRGGQADRAST